jgi:hypothetical protein
MRLTLLILEERIQADSARTESIGSHLQLNLDCDGILDVKRKVLDRS